MASPAPRFSLRSAMPVAVAAAIVLAGVVILSFTAGQASRRAEPQDAARVRFVAANAHDLSQRSLASLTAGMDPAALALARRLDPAPHTDFWGRPKGWEVLDRRDTPSLGFGVLWWDDARRINALMPNDGDAIAATPFVLHAKSKAEADRALFCMTQAIYYEAALEPTEGQQAVAQTVLNRLRHPDYPKSICGVIYEGSDRFTGCQFSFTCDGSLFREPDAFYWNKAKAVAQAALNGFVMKTVGTTTHYHANYVFPRWGATLVRVAQLGAHIFYRFPGPPGSLAAFTSAYRGNELAVSLTPRPRPLDEIPPEQAQDLAFLDPLAPLPGGGAGAGPPGATTLAAAAPGAPAIPGSGLGILPSRPKPTAEQVAQINRALAKLPQAAPPPPPSPYAGRYSDELPISTNRAD